METPVLSIIIPVYNGEQTVKRAVDSIIDLNHSGIEIILTDDHSTDQSLKICEKLAKDYNFIKVIPNKNNVGVAQSRQYGLNECAGEFVTFCDQDDIICASYESFIREMQEKGADILAANYMISYKGNSQLSGEIEYNATISGNKDCKYLAKGVLYKGFKTLNKPVLANTIWNCIFRRSVITKNNLIIKSYVSYEDDWLFLIDFLSVSKKALLSASPFYTWIVSDNSQSKQKPFINNHIVRSIRLITKVNDQAHNIVDSRIERCFFIMNCFKWTLYSILTNHRNRTNT